MALVRCPHCKTDFPVWKDRPLPYCSKECKQGKPLDKHPKPPAVYFIVDVNRQFVKIGVSADPMRRLKDIQAGCPLPLFLLGTTPGGYGEEQALHARYEMYRVHHEWFHYPPIAHELPNPPNKPH